MAVKTYQAGVKEYRQTYWMPEYTPLVTDLLACFKITPQPGVAREDAEKNRVLRLSPPELPLDRSWLE